MYETVDDEVLVYGRPGVSVMQPGRTTSQQAQGAPALGGGAATIKGDVVQECVRCDICASSWDACVVSVYFMGSYVVLASPLGQMCCAMHSPYRVFMAANRGKI